MAKPIENDLNIFHPFQQIIPIRNMWIPHIYRMSKLNHYIRHFNTTPLCPAKLEENVAEELEIDQQALLFLRRLLQPPCDSQPRPFAR